MYYYGSRDKWENVVMLADLLVVSVLCVPNIFFCCCCCVQLIKCDCEGRVISLLDPLRSMQ